MRQFVLNALPSFLRAAAAAALVSCLPLAAPAQWLNHPQGCLGFRIETPAGIVAYATDNEPGDAPLDANLIVHCVRGLSYC